MTKCTTCGAVYEPAPANGQTYFHKCPPLSDYEVVAKLALGANPQLWTAAQTLAFTTADRTRPNTRDENITTAAPLPTPAPMKSAGGGVTIVP